MAWSTIQIPAGVIRNATPYDLPNRWWDTSNVRWVAGAICPVGGNVRVSIAVMPSQVRKLFQWRDNLNNLWLAVGHENGARVEYGGDYDVTPGSFVGISNIGKGGYGVGPYSDPSPVEDYDGTTVVKSSAVTITIASPGVITWPQHGLTKDDVVRFATTGALPTGIAANTAYYVIPVDTNTFHICTIAGGKEGTPIVTSGSQSGSHTASWYVGQDTYGRQRSSTAPQYTEANFWSFSSFGEDLLAVCSSDGRLLHMPTSGGSPVQMDVPSNAPVSNTAVLVTAERSAVLLGAEGNKRRVAWSDFEDYNGWTFNASTGQAGYYDIEASSPIVNGVRVKEGILILTQNEAFLMRYVGAPYFYGFEKLGKTSFATPNCLTASGGMAMWFGSESFWIYDGSAVRPIECPFFNDLKNDYDPVYGNYRSHMHENGLFPEFWMDYPDVNQTDGECNHYVIYNYAENWWARGNRNRTAAIGAGSGPYPIATGKDRVIYQHETGWTDDGVSRVGNVYAETSYLTLAQGGLNLDINQALVPVDPQYGSQNYSLTFLTRYAGDQPEASYGPYVPRTDGYTDCRATGRDFRMRIMATTDAYWSLGPVRFDVEARGGFR